MSSTCKLSTPRNWAHINTKVHVVVNDNVLPVKALITSGTVADCLKAIELIDGLQGDIVISNRAMIAQKSWNLSKNLDIPPRKNRLQQMCYDKWLYKRRHLVDS